MRDEYDQLIQAAVEKHLPGYDWRLYKAQLHQESSLRPDVVSPAGAAGIAQFMPMTWVQWAPRAGYAGHSVFEPEASIFTGAAYMAYLIGQWSWPRPEIDRHCLAMASYNAGLGHLLSAQKLSGGKSLYKEIVRELPAVTRHHANETISYVGRILGYYNQQVTG